MTKPKKLGFVPLVASTFFMVSGGAYGLEELVARGYVVAITALLVTPLLWSLPTALMVGELTSALPDEGGYYAWVRRALGPFWGFQEAWLSLVASIFDMAIYPTLFTVYLGYFFPWVGGGTGALITGALVIAACGAWNMRGAAAVGVGSVALGVALLAPFVIFAALALAGHAHPPPGSLAASQARSMPGLLPGILVAMWNYMGWDNASTIAEEVERPRKTYALAVLATLGVVVLAYVVPVCAAAVAGFDPNGWTTGSWVVAAHSVGGRGLALAVVVGGMLCGVGMFNALLLSYSRLPVVLAEHGYLPAWLSARNAKSGAPRVAIGVCSLAYVACLGIGFVRLVELDVVLYGASLVLEFVALVSLRVREPTLRRPFRVPGGIPGAVVLGLAPLGILGVALWQCRLERVGPMSSLTLGAMLAGLGPIVYSLRRRAARGSKDTALASPPGRG